ncbi:hypothetical protein GCM10007387_48980 [Pseudoduganella albidiflava]|uniref:Uncharacterized protein n=1 Tax=Pseudoduganella albidiflava TaxID=321983 RepID=A0AA88C544_9BURK|nr:hypothetical protein GCM10007387_48980 [Pseudoduganella albidiflava]
MTVPHPGTVVPAAAAIPCGMGAALPLISRFHDRAHAAQQALPAHCLWKMQLTECDHVALPGTRRAWPAASHAYRPTATGALTARPLPFDTSTE